MEKCLLIICFVANKVTISINQKHYHFFDVRNLGTEKLSKTETNRKINIKQYLYLLIKYFFLHRIGIQVGIKIDSKTYE